MVATQKIHVGMIHARKAVTVIAEDNQFTLLIDVDTVAVVPRTTTREVHRYKAHATQAARAPAGQPAGGSHPSPARSNSTKDGDRESGPA